jgi:hypothetical protein
MNGTRLQNSQRNWRNDPDIISMETRILPKNTPPATAPSAPRAMRLFPQVQIPVRNQTQSSATPECSTPTIHLSRKRPQSSDSPVNPTPSKRHRVVILEGSPIPKREPDQASDDTSPATNTTTVAGNDVDKDFADDARVETSARDKSNLSYAQ